MKTVTTPSGQELNLVLIESKDDPRVLARTAIRHSDLLCARDETWLFGLRAGVLDTDLFGFDIRIWPGENRGAERIAGYAVELSKDGRSFRRNFTISSLAHVARRLAQPLAENKELPEDGRYSYFLTTLLPQDEESEEEANTSSRVTRRFEPPVFEPAPLADFVARSEPLAGASLPAEDEAPADLLPIFAEAEVWEQGHDLARRGGELESAAIYTGRLFKDTESAERFLVLDACIEAEHAAEEKLAVTFTGETWANIRERLELRRQTLARPHERICGSVHGHPFMPEADSEGRRTCDACSLAKVCSRTTAVASVDDLNWHRSVFVANPWSILTIFGFNAREEEDFRVYGLSDGTLVPRTIHRLKS